ncbi:vacuolar fusion protein MON1 homolog B isoform X1 [Colossoma macropomum]|uniref:vacuolar fusion protein MON1 homolog B isoform X1 n=1 Tax=Colossoma macropomum TaxID=42526 RepID=UPI0018655D70|nr:vacuolar fusion protein MON1 homolog B isoform X1 [Colossoma macropomum]
MFRRENAGDEGLLPKNTDNSFSTDVLEESSDFTAFLAGAELKQDDSSPSLAADCPAVSQSPSNHNEDVTTDSWRSRRKHVFVLSEAGKPIYSRYGSEEALSSVMGVMMALMSFVQAGGNTIQSIHSDGHTIVFLQKGPLMLVSASKSHQSELQLRSELLHVYHQIVSMLTQASINRIFQHRKNYDLRRLLFGSERVLDTLLDVMETEAGFLLSAVQCLPLAPSARDALSQILQKAVTPNLVLSILLINGQLISIVQEKMVIEDARLKPTDLHLLLNLIRASSAFQTGEIWTPICLPCFNPDCYFYTYVAYLDPPDCTVCLVLLSTDKEAFHALAECKRKIEEGIRTHNALQCISKAQQCQVHHVGVAELSHFLFKPLDIPDHHSQLPQFTSPDVEAPYSTEEEQIYLMDLYWHLHSRIHSTSRPLKLLYHATQRETLLAWVTGKFEMYACFSPLVTKSSAIGAVTKLLRWIKKEEDCLFIRSPLKYSTTPPEARGFSNGRVQPNRQDKSDSSVLSLL